VYLSGATSRQTSLSRDHQGPRAVLNALERLARDYPSECERVRQNLSIAEAQLRDYQARLGKPFPHEENLSELTCLRDRLKARLSATAQGDDAREAVSELAARIKALKAANTIEATPQRAQRKHAPAEEPVTARIRWRHAEASEALGAENVPSHETVPPNDNHHAANYNRPLTFANRIANERQRQDQGPCLP
jgi:chromosome segregation ATPase